MTTTIGVEPRLRRARLPAAVGIGIAACWAAAIIAETSGASNLLHHDALVHGTLPFGAALLVSVTAWQVMIGAMMLPSSAPMIRLFAATTPTDERAKAVAAFIGGYVLVWTSFGAAAYAFDAGIHRVVHRTPWLDRQPWLVGGATLALAGAFQFSAVKDRCLDRCRHPAAYLLRHYRRGTSQAFRIGQTHGLFCLGCCWALMLVMFAAGVSNLLWMAGLSAVMAYEKIGLGGRRLSPVLGAILLAWAGAVLVHPTWLPDSLAGIPG